MVGAGFNQGKMHHEKSRLETDYYENMEDQKEWMNERRNRRKSEIASALFDEFWDGTLKRFLLTKISTKDGGFSHEIQMRLKKFWLKS